MIPLYLHRGSGQAYEAIQFIEADERTHWHVNLGHPQLSALDGKYWARTPGEGEKLVDDKDWIVRKSGSESNLVQLVKPDDFERLYVRIAVSN